MLSMKSKPIERFRCIRSCLGYFCIAILNILLWPAFYYTFHMGKPNTIFGMDYNTIASSHKTIAIIKRTQRSRFDGGLSNELLSKNIRSFFVRFFEYQYSMSRLSKPKQILIKTLNIFVKIHLWHVYMLSFFLLFLIVLTFFPWNTLRNTAFQKLFF